MNKYLKYTLIALGIVAFIELQVILTFTIINSNDKTNNNIPSIENTFNKGGFNPGGMPNGNQPNMQDDDISNNAITPGNNSNSKKSNSTNNA